MKRKTFFFIAFSILVFCLFNLFELNRGLANETKKSENFNNRKDRAFTLLLVFPDGTVVSKGCVFQCMDAASTSCTYTFNNPDQC